MYSYCPDRDVTQIRALTEQEKKRRYITCYTLELFIKVLRTGMPCLPVFESLLRIVLRIKVALQGLSTFLFMLLSERSFGPTVNLAQAAVNIQFLFNENIIIYYEAPNFNRE